MIDQFEALLKDLSPLVGTALHIDKTGGCKLSVNHSLHVNLQCDPKDRRLLMASFIGEIPPGKFRENLLKDALRANEASPFHEVLGYSERNNQLALFSYTSFEYLSADKLYQQLKQFVAKANEWKVAIETGNTSHLLIPTKK